MMLGTWITIARPSRQLALSPALRTSFGCLAPSCPSRSNKQHHTAARMPPPTDREEILAGLRKTINSGQLIVGAGAGIGLSAKFIEQGGGDLIIIYNSGRYRMAGRGSLAGLMPYGNANDVVIEMVSTHVCRGLVLRHTLYNTDAM